MIWLTFIQLHERRLGEVRKKDKKNKAAQKKNNID